MAVWGNQEVPRVFSIGQRRKNNYPRGPESFTRVLAVLKDSSNTELLVFGPGFPDSWTYVCPPGARQGSEQSLSTVNTKF